MRHLQAPYIGSVIHMARQNPEPCALWPVGHVSVVYLFMFGEKKQGPQVFDPRAYGCVFWGDTQRVDTGRLIYFLLLREVSLMHHIMGLARTLPGRTMGLAETAVALEFDEDHFVQSEDHVQVT